jgi:hypothetical protein
MWQEQKTDSDRGDHSDKGHFSNLASDPQQAHRGEAVARAGEAASYSA